MSAVIPDPWDGLRALTPARIALGRAGGSLPTAEWLGFSAAHAAARDAVWSALDVDALAVGLEAVGLPIVRVRSQARDRTSYLQRPDLGRRLDPEDEAALGRTRASARDGCDLALIVADGLSATAAQRHAAPLVALLAPRLVARGLRIGPIVVAVQARVALEDAVGAAMGARAALILLGERPGLGSPDSLAAYLVFGPRVGRTDAERNCVSNIRPDGCPLAAAAELLEWLLVESLRRALSGVGLKDERGTIAAARPPPLLGPE